MPGVVAFAVEAVWAATGATAFTVAVGTATASFTYAALIGYAVTIGGSIAYGQNQAARARNAAKNLGADQGRNVMTRDPMAYRRLIYGEVPVSGSIPFMATTGVKNEYLHVIMMVAGHEVDTLGTIYFDAFEEVPLDGSGNATGKYAGYFTVKKHLGGADQAADADLIAATGLWTSAHTLKGCAYLYLQFKYNADLFPNGMPLVRCLTKGKKVFDPRVGTLEVASAIVAANRNIAASTSGLAVGMLVVSKELLPGTRITFLDPGGTYYSVNTDPIVSNATATCTIGVDAWTDTAALCCADLLSDRVWGKGIPWARIDQTGLAAESNICEEVITLLSGTEPRYALNGTATCDQSPDTILLDMVSSMAGKITETGGIWGVLAGAYRTPGAHTFVDDDLCGSFNLQPRQSMRDTFSGVKGTFFSPDNLWVPTDFVPQKNDTYMGYDGGVRRWKDIGFGFVTSSYQAQRLAKIELERGRLQKTFTAPYKLGAFGLKVGDTLPLTRAVLGYTAKPFEVSGWEFVVNDGQDGKYLSVSVTARETASGVYDWDNGSETVVDLAPDSSLPDPSVVPTPSLNTPTSDSWLQPDGTFLPRVKLTWATPNNIFVETGNGLVRVEYKKHADATWIVWDEPRGDILQAFITDVQIGIAYDFRVQWQNQAGVRGAYDSELNYTVTNDTTAPSTPTNFAQQLGTGKLVYLSWDDNRLTYPAETDLLEYYIYRNTVNTPPVLSAGHYDPTMRKGTVSSNRFVDSNVNIGTNYYYWITAVDFSGNESVISGTVGPATPSTIGSGSVDSTAPSDPAAPTINTTGTLVSGDGTIAAYTILNVPNNTVVATLPTGAVVVEVLARVHGTAGWTLYNEFFAGDPITTRVDGLSPNTAYDYAYQAVSFSGARSNIVPLNNQTSAQKSAPGNCTSGHLTAPSGGGNVPALVLSGSQVAWGCAVDWTAPSDLDIDHYELKATNTDSDGATDYTWFSDGAAALLLVPATKPSVVVTFPIYNLTPSPAAGYVRVRAVNSSMVPSAAWLRIGNANALTSLSTGTLAIVDSPAPVTNGGTAATTASGARTNLGLGSMAVQAASAVALTGGTEDSLARTQGSLKNFYDFQPNKSASAGTMFQGLVCIPISLSFAGGATTEAFDVSLPAGCFTTKPNWGIVIPVNDNYTATFLVSNGSNTTTLAKCELRKIDGTNIPAGTFVLMGMWAYMANP